MKGIISNFSDLSDSKELMENKPKPFAIWFIYGFIALVSAAFIWTYFGEIDIVVKADGIVRPSVGVSTLTSKISGKLLTINFGNGEVVEKNDLLFTIDHGVLLIQKQGLEKELEKAMTENTLTQKLVNSILKKTNLFDPQSESEYYQKYAQYEMELLKVRESIDSYTKRIETYQKVIDGYSKLIESIDQNKNCFEQKDEYALKYLDYTFNINDLDAQCLKAQVDYTAMEALYETGSVSENELKESKNEYLKTQNALEKYKNEVQLNYKSAIEEAKNNQAQYQLELSKLTPETQTKSGFAYYENEQLIDLNSKLEDYATQIDRLNESIQSIDLDVENASIRSPIEGILNVEQNYVVGDQIGIGMAMGTVVPTGDTDFKIQLSVKNRDISQIHVGDDVKFKFQALPYKEYGMLEGQIIHINADSSYNALIGTRYYLVEAQVDSRPLVSYKGETSTIKVGMTLEGQIITKRKKILHYLLEKIDLW
ncbi:HlyD family efflux transporter periplasmic adaptor subunit [Fusibacter sp. 3D3]|uniref:HlyD family efflux transporter periplasmic adaptor subunit n=1 Tax=Fusibacter sp. 3D3 TaxID=1048380 RepID=UPI0008537701|nr:HlyD family efflux transporter periplasmic adaptor subunit [Fusibacter sp. 3D3]GAU78180.1 HlyD family secretion protein [Fusibacter sp. 3D3]